MFDRVKIVASFLEGTTQREREDKNYIVRVDNDPFERIIFFFFVCLLLCRISKDENVMDEKKNKLNCT